VRLTHAFAAALLLRPLLRCAQAALQWVQPAVLGAEHRRRRAVEAAAQFQAERQRHEEVAKAAAALLWARQNPIGQQLRARDAARVHTQAAAAAYAARKEAARASAAMPAMRAQAQRMLAEVTKAVTDAEAAAGHWMYCALQAGCHLDAAKERLRRAPTQQERDQAAPTVAMHMLQQQQAMRQYEQADAALLRRKGELLSHPVQLMLTEAKNRLRAAEAAAAWADAEAEQLLEVAKLEDSLYRDAEAWRLEEAASAERARQWAQAETAADRCRQREGARTRARAEAEAAEQRCRQEAAAARRREQQQRQSHGSSAAEDPAATAEAAAKFAADLAEIDRVLSARTAYEVFQVCAHSVANTLRDPWGTLQHK